MNGQWMRWHVAELAAVTAPTVAAVTVHPAWLAVTALFLARWVRAELSHRPDPPPPHPGRDTQREDMTA